MKRIEEVASSRYWLPKIIFISFLSGFILSSKVTVGSNLLLYHTFTSCGSYHSFSDTYSGNNYPVPSSVRRHRLAVMCFVFPRTLSIEQSRFLNSLPTSETGAPPRPSYRLRGQNRSCWNSTTLRNLILWRLVTVSQLFLSCRLFVRYPLCGVLLCTSLAPLRLTTLCIE